MFVSLSTHLFAFHEITPGIAGLFPRFGFRAAEIWAMPPHFPYGDGDAADRVADILAAEGVRIASLHAPIYPDIRTYKTDRWYSLSSDEEERRQESVAATASAGLWLAARGGGTLVLHTTFPAAGWYPHRWAAFHSSMNELLERIPPGVRLAVENTPLSSGRTDVVLDIVDRYPAERVGVCLDVGHANIQESAVDAVRRTGPRLVHVHASDNHAAKDDHFVPGRGSIPWERVLGALREVGFDGALTMELRDLTRTDPPLYGSFAEILAECRAFLDSAGVEP